MEIVNLVLLALNFKIIDVKKIYKNYKILIVQIGLMDFVQNVHQAHILMNKENANLLMINVKHMIREMGDVYLVIMLLNL